MANSTQPNYQSLDSLLAKKRALLDAQSKSANLDLPRNKFLLALEKIQLECEQ